MHLDNFRVHSIRQNLTKTSFGFRSFMHSICEPKTGFAEPSKPAQEMVWLTNPETVQLFTLTAVDKLRFKSMITMYLFFEKYITLHVDKSYTTFLLSL